MYVGIHCGWGTHVSCQATMRFTSKLRPRQRVVTSSPGPANSRPQTANRHPDTRRNLYVLGLPFDLVKYAPSTM